MGRVVGSFIANINLSHRQSTEIPQFTHVFTRPRLPPDSSTFNTQRSPQIHKHIMSSQQDNRDTNGDELADGLNNLNMEERLGEDGNPLPKTDEEYAEAQLTLRAIVSSKEAGVIIGKGGKNVADLRDETGVKAGVSKVVQGVHDRVLTIAGGCEAISKAYAIVAKALLEGAPSLGMGGVISNNGTHRNYNSEVG